MTKLRPYLVTGQDAEGEELHSLLPEDRVFGEEWLQELLYKHPSILPVGLLDEAFSPPIAIGREIAATDNLFISPKGLLTIVETKLWRNPEAHRTVVAQILEYAKTLAAWDYQQLEQAVQAFMQKEHGQPRTLFKIVQTQARALDVSEIEFQQMVQDGLANGRFALLVVGDRIFPGATQLADLIQSAPHLQFSMAFVELRCFRLKKDSNWPLLVIPSYVAKTKETVRAVVRIVYQEKKPEVQVETPSQEETSSGFTSLSEFIASMPAIIGEVFRPYIKKWMEAGHTIYWGTVGFSLRIDWKGKKTTLFEAYPDRASVIRDKKAQQIDVPKSPFSKYRASLMESPAISSAIASGKTYIRFENMSDADVAMLLSSTDNLLHSLSGPQLADS